jgi:ribosomal protein S18 acetylase RimI-like enzyme
MPVDIRKINLQSSSDLEPAFLVMRQLRPHLSLEQFLQLTSQMHREQYELWAAFANDVIVGLVSTRAYTDLVRGTHLYIDDLVTDQTARSKGIGAALLVHVEKLSKELGFETLRLSCTLENEKGLKFYRREGWKERAFALVKKVSR